MRRDVGTRLAAGPGGACDGTGERRHAGRRWPPEPPCVAVTADARQEEATRTALRLTSQVEAIQGEEITTNAGPALALMEKGVPAPRSETVWLHTTTIRAMGRCEL